MSRAPLVAALRHLHDLSLARSAVEQTDRQLLDVFAARRDEAAFAALVRRHGPMVLARAIAAATGG